MLEIRNLSVNREGKPILKDFNLSLQPGKTYALMGPNGSGKSTLANVLMGDPKYEVISGKVLWKGKNLLTLSPDKRAKLGIFLSFQNPVEIPGVTVSNFLRQAYNATQKKKLSFLEFKKLLEATAASLGMDTKFLSRYLNQGFSGGEKKKAEILQMLMLNPKLAVLDETDSGLDIDALKAISKAVAKFKGKDKTVLIITHYKRILEHIKPDKVFIMIQGSVVKEGTSALVNELEKKGYGWLK